MTPALFTYGELRTALDAKNRQLDEERAKLRRAREALAEIKGHALNVTVWDVHPRVREHNLDVITIATEAIQLTK